MFLSLRKALSVEDWSKRVSNRFGGPACADEIIAAAIAQSIAKNFDDWIEKGCFKKRKSSYRNDVVGEIATLMNEKKGVTVRFGQRIWSYDEWRSKPRLKGTTVNGIEISPDDALLIWNAYHKMKARVQAVKDAEQKALSSMKKNEAAWDLVEKLLGLKRNEHGALVPVNPVEA